MNEHTHHYVKTGEIARPDAGDLEVWTCVCGDSYTVPR